MPPSLVSSAEEDCDTTENAPSSQQIEFNLDCFAVDDIKNSENNGQEKGTCFYYEAFRYVRVRCLVNLSFLRGFIILIQ